MAGALLLTVAAIPAPAQLNCTAGVLADGRLELSVAAPPRPGKQHQRGAHHKLDQLDLELFHQPGITQQILRHLAALQKLVQSFLENRHRPCPRAGSMDQSAATQKIGHCRATGFGTQIWTRSADHHTDQRLLKHRMQWSGIRIRLMKCSTGQSFLASRTPTTLEYRILSRPPLSGRATRPHHRQESCATQAPVRLAKCRASRSTTALRPRHHA